MLILSLLKYKDLQKKASSLSFLNKTLKLFSQHLLECNHYFKDFLSTKIIHLNHNFYF